MSAARPQVRCQPILGEALDQERAASRRRVALLTQEALERIRGREPTVAGFLCGRAARNGKAVWFPRPDQGGRRKAAE